MAGVSGRGSICDSNGMLIRDPRCVVQSSKAAGRRARPSHGLTMAGDAPGAAAEEGVARGTVGWEGAHQL